MTRPLPPLGIRAYTATTAVGAGIASLAAALREQRSGLRPLDDPRWPLRTWVGRVAGLEGDGLQDNTSPSHGAETPNSPGMPHGAAMPAWPDRPDWPDWHDWPDWDCRPTRLAWLGLHADGFAQAVQGAKAAHGAHRVGLILGTAAATIEATERAYAAAACDGQATSPSAGGDGETVHAAAGVQLQPRLATPHALAAFVQRALGLAGPVLTVSTACSSSAKALASAARWLEADLVDAVVVAGVDALCASLLHGFRSLGLLAEGPCTPFGPARCGISIGEAAAFVLLDRAPAPLQLLGHGEANDAHHMSAPHPEGVGAEAALAAALACAGLDAAVIDLVNLHGTATPQNDAVEAALVARAYPPGVHVHATKGLTGHTMGAAGLLEAVIGLVALDQGLAPGSAHAEALDPALPAAFAARFDARPRTATPRTVASHSFGFGGSNAVVILGRREAAAAATAAALNAQPRAMAPQRLWIHAVGAWAPGLPDWAAVQAALRGEAGTGQAANGAAPPAAGAPRVRPSGALLPANERRRAPDSVLVALEVAQALVQAAGLDAATLPSVFTSTHGDLAIVDALCQTLAGDPALLSPMRFHHSVHNAASGYWGMASHSRRASTAVTHHPQAWAAGWLEAATLARSGPEPVLLVGYDTAAQGLLAAMAPSAGLLGLGLLLSARPDAVASTHTRQQVDLQADLQADRQADRQAGGQLDGQVHPQGAWQVDWQLVPRGAVGDGALARAADGRDAKASSPLPSPPPSIEHVGAGNAMAPALPLFAALSAGRATVLRLPLDAAPGLPDGAGLDLLLALQPLA